MEPTTIQTGKKLQISRMIRNSLLVCGIISSLLYVGTDIIAAMQWEGYSYTSQTVSELMAIGAPTRPLVVLLFAVYDVLVIAFGLGIMTTDSQKRILCFTGVLLIGFGIVGFATSFFPMHLRGAETTFTDIMHIIFTCVTMLLILSFIGFGAAAFEKGFRLYSIVTILIIILFGVWAGIDGPRVMAQLPTPWIGIKERINIYACMLWILVLAIILLRKGNGQRSR